MSLSFERIAHRAMGTTFEWVADHARPGYARQASQEAFEEIDRLEGLLSNYREHSEIEVLNRAPVGRAVALCPDTMDCLVQARKLHRETFGLFDVTIGALMQAWGGGLKTGQAPDPEILSRALEATGWQHLALDPEARTAVRGHPGLRVDLGGIGKGFALDAAAEIAVRDWEVSRLLLHSGTSTVLALDPPRGESGWPVGRGPETIRLKRAALSASGRAVRGNHILDPRTGRPALTRERVWVTASDATRADAYSTALMLMSDEQIAAFRRAHPGIELVF